MVPKLVVMKMPDLDKFMADGCSKSTKAVDKAISCIKVLMLDVTGQFPEVQDLINATMDSKELEQDLKKTVSYIEAAKNRVSCPS